MSSFWIQDGSGPKSNDKWPFKGQKRRRHRETQRGRGQEDRREIGGMQPQAENTKACPQPAETGREAWKSFSLR